MSTNIKVKREWRYLYRAVDKQGNTVDFLLSERRDIGATKLFFTQAINMHGAPEKITLDGYVATHTAIHELKQSTILPVNVCARASMYLNSFIEQDHRRVKQRVHPMLGFKRFRNAAVIIIGIELAHRIQKGTVRHHRDEVGGKASRGALAGSFGSVGSAITTQTSTSLTMFAPQP